MSYEHEHENILSAYVHTPHGGRLHALLDPQARGRPAFHLERSFTS